METSKTQAYLSQNLGDATPSSSPNMGDKSPSVGDTGTPEEEEIVENPFEKKKRKRTSKVWDEFKEVVLPDGSKKAECVHCKSILSLNKTGATTQFTRHLGTCTRRLIALKGQK